jgi:hypothetical protein
VAVESRAERILVNSVPGSVISSANAPGHRSLNISVLNLGTRLSTWMLRLDRSPSHIEQELQALAAHITQRAASASV